MISLNTKKPKVVFIVTCPRSYSTLLWRIFAQHPSIDAICEPLTDFMYSENYLDAVKHEKSLSDLKSRIEANILAGKHTVIKDMSISLKEPGNLEWIFEVTLKGIVTDYVYLVRDPVASILSYQRVASKLNDPKYYVRLDFGYQDLLKLYQLYHGPVVISERFMSDPHETISSLCASLMIDFEPIKSLKWEPIQTD